MFDETLSKYASEVMKRREGMRVKTDHHIESLRWGEPGKPSEMDPKGALTITTKEEGEVGCGMVVWATGNEMNTFVNRALGKLDSFPASSAVLRDSVDREEAAKSSWSVSKIPKIGAILVDDHLRVLLKSEDDEVAYLKDVFALGDCCAIETGSPPATAQVAHQEAKWLAARLNKKDLETSPGFSFHNLGMITYLGSREGLIDLPHERGKGKHLLPSSLKGRTSWLIWKMPYIGMASNASPPSNLNAKVIEHYTDPMPAVSWRNRLRILLSSFTNAVFGTDISRY
jgi:NADH dehydrogenase